MPRVVVPAGGVDGGVEAHPGDDAVVLRDLAQVAVDLRLLRVCVGPLRVECEGEGVEVRRDVAAAAGVLVGPPRPADVVHLLDDDVLDALLGELDGRTDATEPGADDDDPMMPEGGRRVRSLRSDHEATSCAGRLRPVSTASARS